MKNGQNVILLFCMVNKCCKQTYICGFIKNLFKENRNVIKNRHFIGDKMSGIKIFTKHLKTTVGFKNLNTFSLNCQILIKKRFYEIFILLESTLIQKNPHFVKPLTTTTKKDFIKFFEFL